MPRRKGTSTAVVRWWALGGEETCLHCGQVYAYELEFRCPDCDEPCCPHCKARHTDDRDVCPSCVDGCDEQEREAHG